METQVMDNQVSTNDTEPQVTETKPAENNVDLSAYFKDGEAGVFDENKIEKLAKDYENQKKSTSYFKSMYMKKNPVPETADGYAKSFKADSMYEGVMGEESVKSAINEIRKFAFDNKIGEIIFLKMQLNLILLIQEHQNNLKQSNKNFLMKQQKKFNQCLTH